MDVYLQVRDLVARKAGIAPESIRPTTRLFHDLGIYGDDADELIEDFARVFAVDVSTFPFSAYFDHEGAWPWPFVRFLRERGAAEKKPLTVNDLVSAVKVGALK